MFHHFLVDLPFAIQLFWAKHSFAPDVQIKTSFPIGDDAKPVGKLDCGLIEGRFTIGSHFANRCKKLFRVHSEEVIDAAIPHFCRSAVHLIFNFAYLFDWMRPAKTRLRSVAHPNVF